MLFPIGDTPNPRNFKAWINWSLLAINVAVYLVLTLPLSSQPANPQDPALVDYLRVVAPSVSPSVAYQALGRQISAYDLFVFKHGYRPGAPEVSDLLFAMFLHANFWHLAGNMLFLWIYGDNVEHRLGRVGYLLTYVLTGVAATLVFALFAGSSLLPMIGASGAISGVSVFSSPPAAASWLAFSSGPDSRSVGEAASPVSGSVVSSVTSSSLISHSLSLLRCASRR